MQNNPMLDIENNRQLKMFLLQYKRNRKVKALKVLVKNTNFYHKQLKKNKALLDISNLDKIVDFPPKEKIILVERNFTIDSLTLIKNQKDEVDTDIAIVEHQITLNYKTLSTQQLLDLFTNSKIPFPNSFQTVGHLAHYNLTPQQQPFHKVIGQITLLKCLNITCVVNKTQKLHNIYRTPQLEMMAGQQDYFVKLKEVGTLFQLDFQKVYWCSRLQQERDRLLAKMNKGQTLADIFCGCGPLAIRAARKGLFVIANDLNPYGYEYLIHNAKINKVQDQMICFNMCAREVMRKIYKQKQTFAPHFQQPDHIYMNLPVDAIQFLDVFTDYFKDMRTEKLPMVHVNCFVVADSDEKSKQLLAKRIGKTLPGFSQEDIIEMNHIKNVTIIMRMYCVSFKLRGKYQQEKKQGNEQGQKKRNKQVQKQEEQFKDKLNGRKKIKTNEE